MPNPRVLALTTPGVEKPDAQDLADPRTGFKEIAAHLGVKGAFNVNSTSVAAWQALLASLQPEEPRNLETASGTMGRTVG